MIDVHGPALEHVARGSLQLVVAVDADDVMTPAPASSAHGHQRATVEGRNDEPFELSGVIIHPLTIRSALVSDASVADYQVRIGPDARIAIDAVARGARLDVAAVERALTTALAAAGASAVRVTVHEVDGLARDPRTGKTRRFVIA